MVWNLKNPVIKGSVAVTDQATNRRTVVEVSTSSIPTRPETCLFWGGTVGNPRRGSQVVEVYGDWDEARKGHARWVGDPFAVAQAMVDAGWSPR